MTDIKEIIEKYSKLLAVGTSVSYTEAEKRAAGFLTIQAYLIDLRHTYTSEKIRLLTVQTAVYAQEISKGSGKTITQDKISAEASREYIAAREDLEKIENDLAYFKAYLDLFSNGHLFYRQMCKDGHGGG